MFMLNHCNDQNIHTFSFSYWLSIEGRCCAVASRLVSVPPAPVTVFPKEWCIGNGKIKFVAENQTTEITSLT